MERSILLLTFLSLLASFPIKAQEKGDLEFFTDSGKQFYVILNGQQMHENPETNVKLKGLTPDRFSLKVVFEDSSLGTIERNVVVKAGEELSYEIEKNMFDRYAVKPYSRSKIASSEDPGSSNEGNDNSDEPETGHAASSSNSQGQTQPQGRTISVSIHSSDSSYSTTVKTSTTTTQTGTQGSSSTAVGNDQDDASSDQNENPLPDYNGPTGCEGVMSESSYQKAKRSIEKKDFADDKMTLARQVTRSNCLLTDQVKGIVELFDFEDDRVQYAKFAYSHTYDQGNYYRINDSFEFSSSVDELEEYLDR